MPRNRPQLERASLTRTVTTALRRSTVPLLTVEVVTAVVGIAGYSDRSLPAVAAGVYRCLHRMEGRGVTMTGPRGQRLWAIVEVD